MSIRTNEELLPGNSEVFNGGISLMWPMRDLNPRHLQCE